MTLFRPLIAAASSTALATLLLAPAAHADSVMTPDFEVKLQLTSSVLTSSHVPTAALTSALGLGSASTRSYQYIDDSALTLHNAGWDVRERRVDHTGKLQLNYKKRWAIAGSTLTQSAIDTTLEQAKDDDFDSSDDNYDAEVDWGYSSATLSAANDKTATASGFTGDLPTGTTALNFAINDIPGKLDDYAGNGSGTDVLEGARVHGPVTTKQYEGTLNGHDIDLEVVPITNAAGTGTDYLVELSFKTDDFSDAADDRADDISYLDAHGWLVHADTLKTNLILSRY